jgi:hypothetical protein
MVSGRCLAWLELAVAVMEANPLDPCGRPRAGLMTGAVAGAELAPLPLCPMPIATAHGPARCDSRPLPKVHWRPQSTPLPPPETSHDSMLTLAYFHPPKLFEGAQPIPVQPVLRTSCASRVLDSPSPNSPISRPQSTSSYPSSFHPRTLLISPPLFAPLLALRDHRETARRLASLLDQDLSIQRVRRESTLGSRIPQSGRSLSN